MSQFSIFKQHGGLDFRFCTTSERCSSSLLAVNILRKIITCSCLRTTSTLEKSHIMTLLVFISCSIAHSDKQILLEQQIPWSFNCYIHSSYKSEVFNFQKSIPVFHVWEREKQWGSLTAGRCKQQPQKSSPKEHSTQGGIVKRWVTE